MNGIMIPQQMKYSVSSAAISSSSIFFCFHLGNNSTNRANMWSQSVNSFVFFRCLFSMDFSHFVFMSGAVLSSPIFFPGCLFYFYFSICFAFFFCTQLHDTLDSTPSQKNLTSMTIGLFFTLASTYVFWVF